MPAMFDPVKIPFIRASKETDITDADLVVFSAPHGTPYRDIDNAPYASALASMVFTALQISTRFSTCGLSAT